MCKIDDMTTYSIQPRDQIFAKAYGFLSFAYLDNTPYHSFKLGTKNWVEIIDTHGMYNTNSHFKFKSLMLQLSLGDYNDAYILVSGTAQKAGTATAQNNKKM